MLSYTLQAQAPLFSYARLRLVTCYFKEDLKSALAATLVRELKGIPGLMEGVKKVENRSKFLLNPKNGPGQYPV